MQDAFGHIIANAKFLGHRIEEMIGLAQTSDGKLHLDAQKLDAREVVAAAVDDAQFFAASAEVVLVVTVPERPVNVVGDGLWLKRALLAVIENALKFSPTGGQVDIELTEADSETKVVVTDHGPGIYPDELPLVFDAYYQTRSGKERGGSGLGLAMTRWVVEQHGGKAFARNVGGYGRSRGCAVTLVIKKEREV
jgi:signal transduction histidine kinase